MILSNIYNNKATHDENWLFYYPNQKRNYEEDSA